MIEEGAQLKNEHQVRIVVSGSVVEEQVHAAFEV